MSVEQEGSVSIAEVRPIYRKGDKVLVEFVVRVLRCDRSNEGYLPWVPRFNYPTF